MKRGLIVYDYHDTLVDANKCFTVIANSLVDVFKSIFQESYEFWKLEINKYYSRNIKQYGYHPNLWNISMLEIYKDFIDPEYYKKDHVKVITELSDLLSTKTPELFDMVPEVLEFMSRDYDQVLMSNFPRDLLVRDLAEHGIIKYFSEVHGFRWDKSFDMFSHVSGEKWSVGDSLKRDIRPAILQGFSTVFIPYYDTSSLFWPENDYNNYPFYTYKVIDHIKSLPEAIYGVK